MSYEEEVLDDMNRCDKTCTGLAVDNKKEINVRDVDWLLENLPAMDYVLSRMLNYIFANGLTTGNGDSEELDRWLYEDMNLQGATNYTVLRDCIRNAAVYGECGLRMYEGNLYTVKKDYYGILTYKRDGIEEIVAFFIRKDMKKVEEKIDTTEWNFTLLDDIERWFDSNGYILLDESEFVNLRNDTSYLHGISPLLKDKQRINLLLAVYERLNYDIRYDGPGRLFLHTKDGYVSDETNEVSSGEVLNNSHGMKENRYEQAKKEARRIAKDLKNSTSDMVGVLSGGFDKDITYLPRITKATEFLNWLEVDTVIIAQVIGMSPTLLEVGELHGNVSVEKIIDTAMLNTIIPMRENYAVQFSDMIAKRVGVSKVFFNKYDMEQIRDENDNRQKLADIIKTLSYSNKANENDNLDSLIADLSEILKSSLYDDTGELRTF